MSSSVLVHTVHAMIIIIPSFNNVLLTTQSHNYNSVYLVWQSAILGIYDAIYPIY